MHLSTIRKVILMSRFSVIAFALIASFLIVDPSNPGHWVLADTTKTADSGEGRQPVKNQSARTPLWGKRVPVGDGKYDEGESENAFITIHHPNPSEGDAVSNGIAVVICPGGGYGGLVVGPEGHGIADWLNHSGITGIVLEYRLPKGRHAVPLLDANRAIRLVRSKAESLGINPKQIGIMGFSAGGHLASTAATHFDAGSQASNDLVSQQSSRPDFAVLVYPVVTMTDSTHGGSKANLLGSNPTDGLVDLYSNEKQVTDKTPPIFLAHAIDDRPVPIENSQMLYQALTQKGIPAKLLELPSGGHGLNGYKGPMWDQWQEESLAWMLEL
jgi:acetyl esterase/lipase